MINFVLYNRGFEVVEAHTGILPVDDKINKIQQLSGDKMVLSESGYMEIYVNNEAQTPVYFDNLSVTRSSGNAVEVNAYYPYGMIIPLLSDHEIEGFNAYKYNGKEQQTELNWNVYDYGARPYDPAPGRWISPDPLAEKYYHISPYAYALNNPVRFIDPDGRSIKHHMFKNQIDDLFRSERFSPMNQRLFNDDIFESYHFFDRERIIASSQEPQKTGSDSPRGLPTINGVTAPWSIETIEAHNASNASVGVDFQQVLAVIDGLNQIAGFGVSFAGIVMKNTEWIRWASLGTWGAGLIIAGIQTDWNSTQSITEFGIGSTLSTWAYINPLGIPFLGVYSARRLQVF